MPVSDIVITVTVKAINQKGDAKVADVTYTLPKNGILGVAITDPGKLKIGSAAEQLADLLDEDRSPL